MNVLGDLVGVVWIGVWCIAGFVSAFSLADSWSTAYAVTDRRVMIVAPWLQRDYGAEAFARYAIRDDGNLRFDWGDAGRRYGYRAMMHDLEDADAVAALITEHIAPDAQRDN